MENAHNESNQTTVEDSIPCSAIGLDGKQMVFLFAINLAICISAILENILILAAFRKVSSLHPPSKLLFECLAFTDLGVGLLHQPLHIASFTLHKNAKTCSYIKLASWIVAVTFCGVSLLTLAVVSVDRLLALTLKLRYRQVVTLRRTQFIIATLWVGSSVSGLVALYNGRISFMISFLGTMTFITISTFCYITIFIKLFHHQAQIQGQVLNAQHNNVGNQLNISRYRKTVSSALFVQLTLVVCYTPFGVERGFIATNRHVSSFAAQVAWSLVALNSALNPIIYFWKMREVRHAARTSTEQLCCRSRVP